MEQREMLQVTLSDWQTETEGHVPARRINGRWRQERSYDELALLLRRVRSDKVRLAPRWRGLIELYGERLAPEDQDMADLYWLRETCQRDIGRIFGMSQAAVSYRLLRVRRKLEWLNGPGSWFSPADLADAARRLGLKRFMVRSNMGALRAHERNEQTDVPTFLADYWRAETAITRMIGRHFLDNYTASKLLLERVIAKFEASPQPGDELFLKGLRERKKWGAILHLQGGHTRRGWKKGRAV